MNLSIIQLFDVLFAHYGSQKWWPCQSGVRWEIITGEILTQNTAWTNVEKAIGNLLAADVMSPQRVLETSDDELQELIRPAGFFKQKCAYTNDGRIDAVVQTKDAVFIFEFKLDNDPTALEQIKEKEYYKKYLLDKREIYIIGVNFDSEKGNLIGWEDELIMK